MRVAPFVLLISLASGHVDLMWPPSRIQNPSGVSTASIFPTHLDSAGGCNNFACLWFNQGCQPGCSKCSDKAGGPVAANSSFEDTCSEPNGTMPPTLMDKKLRTYKDGPDGHDWTLRNPWRSPGYSPVFSPCGFAGGGNSPGDWMSDSLDRHIRTGAVTPPFIRRGFDGLDLPEGPKTKWAQGSVQEVAWSIFDNKGGGYAYRLCPKSGNITEECFQENHLQFASEKSWVQTGANRSKRTYFNATRVSTGTFPRGSTWTKNPVPPCADLNGQPVQKATANCTSPMFDPPVPDLMGDGAGTCIAWAIHGPVEGYHNFYDSFGNLVYEAPCTKGEALQTAYQFQKNIFDEVTVPESIPTGEYLLSFRLDAEQTPQVWTQCADITITSGKQCSAHKQCSGLSGNCCPTDDGTMLSCCEGTVKGLIV